MTHDRYDTDILKQLTRIANALDRIAKRLPEEYDTAEYAKEHPVERYTIFGGAFNHTHTWSPVTTTVHHDATGHYEDVVVGTRTVVDKEAWDEPVYEWKAYAIRCS